MAGELAAALWGEGGLAGGGDSHWKRGRGAGADRRGGDGAGDAIGGDGGGGNWRQFRSETSAEEASVAVSRIMEQAPHVLENCGDAGVPADLVRSGCGSDEGHGSGTISGEQSEE